MWFFWYYNFRTKSGVKILSTCVEYKTSENLLSRDIYDKIVRSFDDIITNLFDGQSFKQSQ